MRYFPGSSLIWSEIISQKGTYIKFTSQNWLGFRGNTQRFICNYHIGVTYNIHCVVSFLSI